MKGTADSQSGRFNGRSSRYHPCAAITYPCIRYCITCEIALCAALEQRCERSSPSVLPPTPWPALIAASRDGAYSEPIPPSLPLLPALELQGPEHSAYKRLYGDTTTTERLTAAAGELLATLLHVKAQ
jgi:hypothetical protein